MNVNEVIGGFPMGVPKEVYTAFGSNYGLQQAGDARGKHTTDVFKEWLAIINRDLSDEICACRGWIRNKKRSSQWPSTEDL